MPVIDWGILIVAGSSLIFAIVAFRQVMITTGMIRSVFEGLPKDPSKIITADFGAEVLSKALTKGIAHEDGSPVSVGDMIGAYMDKYGPVMMDRFQKQLPSLIPIYMKAQAEIANTIPSGQTPGQALAGQRWGSPGGLKAMKTIGKATGTSKIVEKIQTAGEVAGAIGQIIPMIKDAKEAIGLKPSNGGGGSAPSHGGGERAGEVWTPA